MFKVKGYCHHSLVLLKNLQNCLCGLSHIFSLSDGLILLVQSLTYRDIPMDCILIAPVKQLANSSSSLYRNEMWE